MCRVVRESIVGFIRVLKIDDVEIIAESVAHNLDGIVARAREMGDIQNDQFFDDLGCQHGHLPEQERTPVVTDEYSAVEVQRVQQTAHIRDQFAGTVI